jgi:hypothetical protein
MKSIEEIRETLEAVLAIGNVVAPELSAALDELAALREENAKLRDAIKKHGREAYHVGECVKQDIEAPCTCGADEWNALVRGMQ